MTERMLLVRIQIVALVAVVAPTCGFQPDDSAPEESAPLRVVSHAVQHDTSPPLLELQAHPIRPAATRVIPRRVPSDLVERSRPSNPTADPLRQTEGGPIGDAAATPAPIGNFEGLSDDDNAATVGVRYVPPDTQGDVGPNYYVQWINVVFAFFNKDDGSLAAGPFAGNDLWDGFGGICDRNNDGDPIVLYDHLADRWVFSQFAIENRGGHQCVAVQATDDPMGPYHRYDFLVSPNRGFNDYPKIGVWPDGYYLTANEYGQFNFNGAIAVVFERDAMLAGTSARFAKFTLPCAGECFFSLQPSHLEGPPPAPGTPNTFVMAFDDETWGTGFGSDGYRLWEFSTDWTNESFAFTSLGQVNTSEFDANMCGYSGNCVPQLGSSDGLDTLSQFTMYRAQFRSFSGHDSIVFSHTVDVGFNEAGIRWAELRNDGSGWSLHQSGTYAPADGLHRWMGSIAMDGSGNIALGYSASSANDHPSIRYVTREATDPLGVMPGGEQVLYYGTGSQLGSSNRWGDYASMSVDPVDDCTFWLTTEYYANTASFDFKTRIGFFRLDSCGVTTCTVSADCDDSAFCNGVETCVDGSCRAGTPVDCTDGVGCTIDSCNESTDSCDSTPDDSACDDGAFCNGSETCDALADCQPGTSVNCDDGVGCTLDSCNEGTDSCDNTPDDSACVDDGLFCNGPETCDPVEDCTSGGDPCSPPLTCNEADDSCDCSIDADCDDGAFCNGVETCASGTCQAGTDPCPGQACDEGSDTCVAWVCGNGVCEGAGENCFSCPADCRCAGGPTCTACCGDGVCEGPGEKTNNCPIDCP